MIVDNKYFGTEALIPTIDDLFPVLTSLFNSYSSVRLLEDHSYLFTVRCPVYNPITCMSCDPSSNSDDTPELFCGGFELGVIQPIRDDQCAEYDEIE